MFSMLQNFFGLSEGLAKQALFAFFCVMLAITAIMTRFNLKAILVLLVVGMIAMGIMNNSDAIKKGGDTTVKELQTGRTTTTGLGAPLHTPPPSSAATGEQ